MTSSAITPFRVNVPQSDLDELQQRLQRTRWPDSETVADWSQGVPLHKARELVNHWTQRYDWRRCEATLNAQPQFTTEIEGETIYFIHARSRHSNATPLLLTHGWPGGVVEFLEVIAPLTDPLSHGGTIDDAFHVVIPALPGYGFSSKPKKKGWSVLKIAQAWTQLMQRVGYTDYVAQGGDWGAAVTTVLGKMRPAGLRGIHLNMPLVIPRDPGTLLSPAEAEAMQQMKDYNEWDTGYSHLQSTRPQTLGYALSDSPVGQAVWIYEKFWSWSNCKGDPVNALSLDQMLDVISLYWLTNTGASSARLYWESFRAGLYAVKLELPVGCSIFAREIYRAPRSWAERCMSQLVYWNELDKGGHFAAFEQPDLFVQELRNWRRALPR